MLPPDTEEEWRADLRDLSEQLTASCRAVDPTSTDQLIELAHAADVVEGETAAAAAAPAPPAQEESRSGAGVFDGESEASPGAALE